VAHIYVAAAAAFPPFRCRGAHFPRRPSSFAPPLLANAAAAAMSAPVPNPRSLAQLQLEQPCSCTAHLLLHHDALPDAKVPLVLHLPDRASLTIGRKSSCDLYALRCPALRCTGAPCSFHPCPLTQVSVRSQLDSTEFPRITSRIHATLTQESAADTADTPRRWRITDSGSINGTLVNTVRVDTAVLQYVVPHSLQSRP